MRSGDLVEYLPRESACSQWEPRDEGDSVALTIIHHVIPFTIRKTIAILHGNDGDDLACPLDVLLRDIRQRNKANLSMLVQAGQSSYRILERHNRIGGMQLVDVDSFQPPFVAMTSPAG